MTPPPPPTEVQHLMEDVLEEILLRLPSDDPSHLFRAAVVCKAWRRLICSPPFSRRFFQFHRAAGAPPPLLGLMYRKRAYPVDDISPVQLTRFLPTSTFRLPPSAPSTTTWHAMDTLHGRVLLWDAASQDPPLPRPQQSPWQPSTSFAVWSPVSREIQVLPDLSISSYVLRGWSAALVCTQAGCDHLYCSGAFLAIVAGTDQYSCWDPESAMKTSAHAYSSELEAWDKPVSIQDDAINGVRRAGPRVGNTLYFTVSSTYDHSDRRLLAYDLTNHRLWLAGLPHLDGILNYSCVTLCVAHEGRRLGVVWGMNKEIYTWSRGDDEDGARWTWTRDEPCFELDTLLPP